MSSIVNASDADSEWELPSADQDRITLVEGNYAKPFSEPASVRSVRRSLDTGARRQFLAARIAAASRALRLTESAVLYTKALTSRLNALNARIALSLSESQSALEKLRRQAR
jgi:hypothetical protein